MHTRSTISVVAILAAGALVGSQLVSAHKDPAVTEHTAAAPAASLVDHYLRSGFLTINGDGETGRFSISNSLGKDLQITLSLVDPNGKTVAATKGIVGPDHSLKLDYNPTSTTRVRAVFLTEGDAGLVCNAFAPNLELLRTTAGVTRSVMALDTFWHLDVPVV